MGVYYGNWGVNKWGLRCVLLWWQTVREIADEKLMTIKELQRITAFYI